MKTQHYLVTQTTSFFDPHGTPDEGGTVKFVSDDPHYALLNKDDYFNGDPVENYYPTPDETFEDYLKNEIQDEDNLYGEDGYNCEVQSFSVKKISAKKAEEYKKIIDAYDKL